MPSPGPTILGDAQTPGGSGVRRRRDIQGLRAIAVLAVVLFHAGLPVPGGFVGVDVFFVISGFVITVMLHREWTATGVVRFRTFYIKRFKRLTPALAVMVSVTLVVSAVVMTPFGPQENVAMTALGAMLFTANVVIARTTGGYFDAPAEGNPLLNTWSLSVEEQFYLLFPLLLVIGWYLVRRVRTARHAPLVLVGLVGVISLGLSILGASGFVVPGAPWLLGFYSPFTRAWEFAFGALLALFMAQRAAPTRRVSTGAGVLGAALVLLSLFVITGETPFPGYWALLPVLGALLLILAGFDEGNVVSRALAVGPAVKVGDWSYSIYLWHWPMIVFTGLLWPGQPALLVLAAALSFGPSLASYAWVEQPVRRMGSMSGPRLTAIIAACIVPPIVLAAAVGLSASRDLWVAQLWVPQLSGFSDWSRSHVGWDDCMSRGTMNGDPTQVNQFGACQWNSDAAGAPLYLVGDSNANQFSETLIGASRELGAPLTLDSAASCPLADVVIDVPGVSDAASSLCQERFAATMEALLAAPPGVVVIANADNYIFAGDYSISDGAGGSSSDRAEKAALFEGGLRRTVQALEAAGHSVILVQPVHRFDRPEYSWNVVGCTVLDFAQGGCVTTAPKTFFDELQSESRAAIARVGAETGATVLDLRPYLCDAYSCSTRNEDMALYGDPAHISVEAATALMPVFVEAVNQARATR